MTTTRAISDSHHHEEATMPHTTITDIFTVGIPVSDQDNAVAFFVGTLGFEKRLDARISDSFRWVTVAAPGASTSVALVANSKTGADTGIRFVVPDAEIEHAAMRQRGVETGDLLRWPGVPAMFEFKDPDGNRFEIVEETRAAPRQG
jgi:lactoylglutathione lyase